jgi:enoyl-CoA hydratase
MNPRSISRLTRGITAASVTIHALGQGRRGDVCDFRLAVPGAQFWLPEVDHGVPWGIGTTSRLVSTVGIARAKEVTITGDWYSAEDLHSWGMINRLVVPEMLMATAHDFAKRLIAKNPRGVAGSKLSINAVAAIAAREVTTVQPDLFIHTEES